MLNILVLVRMAVTDVDTFVFRQRFNQFLDLIISLNVRITLLMKRLLLPQLNQHNRLMSLPQLNQHHRLMRLNTTVRVHLL